MSRTEFQSLRDCPEVAVLIVGGGVNGVGLLRELALQGVDTLLVDKSDFCSGTSAAGTRLIHGGLRYLENAEFRLVHEALRERGLLLRNAPHYVKPLPVVMPVFDWTSGWLPALRGFAGLPTEPADRGALLIKTGLFLYDLLAGRESGLPRHLFHSRKQSLARRPALNPGVVCTATYHDARITCPERLCLELVLDAARISPQARALSYVSVQEASGNCVTLRDETSGESRTVRPQVVVNATGPWIDQTNQALGSRSGYIGGTRGSHLVLDHAGLREAAGGDMIYFVNRDGRICMLYALNGKVLAGTTDIRTDNPDGVCSDEEVSYILDSIRQVFPSIQVDRSHVVFRFSGVRPLPSSTHSIPGRISRDHSCPLLPPSGGRTFPIYSLVGGKWTTFRAFSEQAAGQVLAELGCRRVRGSADLPIGGGRDYPLTEGERQAWIGRHRQRTGIAPDRLEELLARYGTRAGEYAAFIAEGQDGPLAHHPGYSRREIEFLVRHERVVHLDDVVFRRTLIGLLGEASRPLLEELAAVAGPPLGWTPQTAAAEVERSLGLLRTRHGATGL
ncbi:MAG: glycerol-3-phosphate dehydrogenase/oxidase [Bryobacterales bacterium]|nr:glycerol-3-phosphate dehydrogenase/oxidase [Bryobacterales bacterium]